MIVQTFSPESLLDNNSASDPYASLQVYAARDLIVASDLQSAEGDDMKLSPITPSFEQLSLANFWASHAGTHPALDHSVGFPPLPWSTFCGCAGSRNRELSRPAFEAFLLSLQKCNDIGDACVASDAALRLFDFDVKKTISFDRFLHLLKDEPKLMGQLYGWRRLFCRYDRDGSGRIDLEEATSLIRDMVGRFNDVYSEAWLQSHAEKMLAFSDRGEEGVSFEKFCAYAALHPMIFGSPTTLTVGLFAGNAQPVPVFAKCEPTRVVAMVAVEPVQIQQHCDTGGLVDILSCGLSDAGLRLLTLQTSQPCEADPKKAEIPKDPPVFSVGDEVRAVAASHGWGSVTEGAIGTIRSVDGDSIRVDFPQQNSWHARARDLVPVRSAKAQHTPSRRIRILVKGCTLATCNGLYVADPIRRNNRLSFTKVGSSGV